jgi:DNA-binding MarR family transcriptional regulator
VTAAGPEANVLGALSLVITDLTAQRVAAAAGQSVSAATALSALHQFLDRPTLDQLRRVLGLTPSGAVRLVDRLADAGLVERGPGGDGRSRSVVLTTTGRQAAERIAAARVDLLAGVLDDLSPAERQDLHRLLGRIMFNVVRAKEGGPWICRLCDLDACGRPAGKCPAATAAAAKYGSQSMPRPRTVS